MNREEKKQSIETPKRLENNCEEYEYQEGCQRPESIYSCRGCKHSYNPALYDGGCARGFHPEDQQWVRIA